MIRWLARLAVSNPIGANLAMVALAVSGVLVYRGMPREVFPDFSLDAIEVFTLLPAASPVDVERQVTTPLEDALDGLEGVREMRSVSREGVSRIQLTLEDDASLATVLADARDRVRGGDVELPEDADDPSVYETRNRFPVIAVFVYGQADELELKRVAEEQARALEALDGVTSVEATGLLEPRIWVEVDPDALERHNLRMEDVASAVRGRVAEAPLGALEIDEKQQMLRIGGEVRWARDLQDLPVVVSPGGATVSLERLARVSEATRRGAATGRFNGLPCVHLQVSKSASGDTIDIAREVRAYVDRAAATMPPGIALGTNSDLSVYVANRLRTMAESGLVGAALVLVALLLFLSPRVALVTALGIPLAFLGGILVSGLGGVTMNMIAMFALIVVLGMIVDDAIVVGENVYRRMEEGEPPEVAAVEGTAEVGRPVVATILTSIAAFLPILLLTGTTGLFLRPLPIVVTACLVVSLFEALTILPSHLAHWTSKRAVRRMQLRARQEGGEVMRWYSPLREAYLGLLRRALAWRYATLSLALGGAGMVAAYAEARLPFVLFDDFESKLFYVSLRLDPSASIDETEDMARQVEGLARDACGEDMLSLHTLLGVAASDVSNYELGTHLGQVWVELREGEGRTRTTAEIVRSLRGLLVGLPPIVESYEIAQPQTGPQGRALEVALRGPDLSVLAAAADEVMQRLARFRGVRDVRTDFESGKRQIDLAVNAHGRQVGLTEADLARQVRTAFEGRTVASVRRGTDDVEIVVKLPEQRRQELASLHDLRVALPPGRARPPLPGDAMGPGLVTPRRVPLGSVARLEARDAPSSVGHEDRVRAVVVSADVDETEGNAAAILRTLQAEWLAPREQAREQGRAAPAQARRDGGSAQAGPLADLVAGRSGYSIRLRGQAEETAESIAGLGAAAIVSGLLIYVVLGTLFQSLLQPFVIMFIIPFAGVGMVLGHGLMGRPITLMSLIGLLALAGVVVNDSLILVDFIGQRRRAGADLLDAVLDSGRLRFRPIVLTSITTMLGLLPLTFFATGQARFLQPMAISIFFGLGVATALILVLVPVAFVVLDDGVRLARRIPRRLGYALPPADAAAQASEEPA